MIVYFSFFLLMDEVQRLIDAEYARQQTGIELIASENYQSPAVLKAQASVFANKYAEGYPGRRYYGGNRYTDELEHLAIDRAKALFHCDYANVQALSGANANLCFYTAVMKPGDTILGMDLTHGGHLTHGAPVTFFSHVFNFQRYQTLPTGEIDFAQVRQLARDLRPQVILA